MYDSGLHLSVNYCFVALDQKTHLLIACHYLATESANVQMCKEKHVFQVQPTIVGDSPQLTFFSFSHDPYCKRCGDIFFPNARPMLLFEHYYYYQQQYSIPLFNNNNRSKCSLQAKSNICS